MATSATLIPVSEYLDTTYRPDRDYVDGELKERNVGERPHSVLQAVLAALFLNNQHEWGLIAMTEQRVQTSDEHYRVADLCVVRETDPETLIVHTAPILCVEILSRKDTVSELQERMDDYFSMGVENVWVIDPWKKRVFTATVRSLEQPADDVLRLPGTPVAISAQELFTKIGNIVA